MTYCTRNFRWTSVLS